MGSTKPPAPDARQQPGHIFVGAFVAWLLWTTFAHAATQPAPAPEGWFDAVQKEIIKALSSTTLQFAGAALLIGAGMLGIPWLLRVAVSTDAIRKTLALLNLEHWVTARAARLYLRKALRAFRNNKLPAARENFALGLGLAARLEAPRPDDRSHFLNDHSLAALHDVEAWHLTRTNAQYGEAIRHADRAIELDPHMFSARIARAWARLYRADPGDFAAAEIDIDAVLRQGEERGTRYVGALLARAMLWRARAEYARAIPQLDALADQADTLPEIRLQRGLAYYSSGQAAKAIDDLAWFIERVPRSPFRVYKADCLRVMLKWPQARAECERILLDSPEDPQARYVRALAIYDEYQAGRASLAAADGDALLESSLADIRAVRDIARRAQTPVAVDIYKKGIEISRLLGKEAEAQRWADEYASGPSVTSVAIANSRPAMASAPERLKAAWDRIYIWAHSKDASTVKAIEEGLKEGMEGDDDAAAWAYCGRAWLSYLNNSTANDTLTEALAFTHEAVARNPKLAFTYYVRGLIMQDRGRYEDARMQFTTAIELGYDTSESHHGLGEAHRFAGQHAAAIASYTKAIERNGFVAADQWRPRYARGLSHAALQDWPRAYQDLHDALALARRANAERSSLASIYADHVFACYEVDKDEELQQAMAAADELGADSEYVHLQLGGVCLYRGQWPDAIRHYTRAIACEPKSATGHVNRGLAHIYAADLAVAMADLDKALALDDKYAAVWHTRGWARLRANQHADARADFDAAISLDPTVAMRFVDRALATWWLGDRAAVAADLAMGVDLRLGNDDTAPFVRLREDAVTWGACAEDWSHAVEKDPSDALAKIGRAACLYFAGNIGGARDDLERGTSATAHRAATALRKHIDSRPSFALHTEAE